MLSVATYVFAAAVAAAPARPVAPAFGPETIADLAERVAPAVANIDTVERRRNPMMELDPFFHGFFGPDGRIPPYFESKGVGSGFVIDAGGLLLTNWHVVRSAQRIVVTFPDGRRFQGRVEGRDPATDIALVRIPAQGLPVLDIAADDRLRVGEWVVAIGNPLGLSTTVTAGIVSALNRGLAINERVPFIQTDAPINPGNSGGPLIDLRGRVVGMTTAVARNTTGIGFAIPAETLRWALPQLKTAGKVERAWLGVTLDSISPDGVVADKLGSGIIIRSVSPGSPAAQAGLREGDLVLAIDGRSLRDPGELIRTLAARRAGERVQLLISRQGQTTVVPVDLGVMPINVQGGSGDR
ncbi:MAG: trypsin-like peptidase domain-containing protein [Candidatus Sericytochromatia bacterium]|nr:trypsin-like peptidase domain-containing protein [Candidatus Tanganyikabacteria bacterium]